ncbi:murein biosynthesis integral membrane protein MurJ [Corynebacterium sp. 153RC1]|uniref:murein biosynthesis integral membrane protein MurJ n=1 Tax=unclassified Corynebacterium TaxID=2624378 RepID=UPI00211CAC7A|nr:MULTISPECIES: murein biosynthesis integral membrane protein MurJ [unclassified Corynebacterium]MCQ9352767.1 murein biosynthesis integral membrane protein MurJ [Corynebacterium sp. 209RC1]MCQ9354951.1 murein biosynthesis integral membrane protein MurJ [Corynebacterium sp. 1222RC1]MCQ9357212.1 murein biosynthesis integral membrane protein MurJ [Corynebacterium sp. 122RC1]MCQ9359387.1 murein biosynthesis integral membrane protein MurJ [Corynebacterium sp. 142RC1]MCQ9361609.1 murein biosynthesi
MHSPKSQQGLRHRIIVPAPPAPVVAQQPRAKLVSAPKEVSDADVVRSTGSMAIATLASRITGFLRNVLITTALGGAVASAFNTANTLPNLITEIVLGAVLTSLVVPVLVRAEKEDPDHGEAFIRRLFTLASSVLIGITVLAVIAAPWLVGLPLGPNSKVNVFQSTSFAYLLLPQIYFYGIFALLMAVLNTKGVFKPGAWAPVVNNVITLAVLSLYMFVPGELHPGDRAPVTDPHVLLLGIGTTLGVVTQAAIMLPAIRRAGVSLKPLWGIDDRLKQFGGMAVAIIVYVAISQAGYFITTRIAAAADAEAPNIYQQAWLLLQVPYGIIGVTLLTAIMPRLSRNAANGDDRAVVHDLVVGSKLTFIALIPIAMFMNYFGPQIANGLFAYGKFSPESATLLGWTLTSSSFTLLPYALVLLHLRVFYAREEAWTPTFIIAGITITKVALSMAAPFVATSPTRVVILLGAANGFGFVAGAVIGGLLLRRKLGNLGMREVGLTAAWALGASAIAGLVALGVSALLSRPLDMLYARIGSPTYLVELAVCGVVFLVITGLILARSGLSEVQSLAGVAGRIPGLNRLIRARTPMPAAVLTATEQLPFDDSFNATPVPPPMSAGIVRGPRLVPGAEVSDGRYRLLAEHGAVATARFWHAKEKATGREVALTFVDTSGQAPQAPRTPAESASHAATVMRHTQILASLKHDGVAPNIQVFSYRNGCLIVADWIPGAPLSSLDPETVEPTSAIHAFAPLADATQAAHEAGIAVGLDNRARIRISTDGVAVLAFPAVLEENSADKDAASLRTALGSLIRADAPTAVLSMFNAPATQLPAAITTLDGAQAAEELEVPDQPEAPQPNRAPGFGAKSYSRSALIALAGLATVLVVLAAVVTAYLTSLLDTPDSPITQESIQLSSQAPEPVGPEIVVAPQDVLSNLSSSGTQGTTVVLDQSMPIHAIVVESTNAVGLRIEVLELPNAHEGQRNLLTEVRLTQDQQRVELPPKAYAALAVMLHAEGVSPDQEYPTIAQVMPLSYSGVTP